MTDGEPEPFVMSMGADDEDDTTPDAPAEPDLPADEAPATGGEPTPSADEGDDPAHVLPGGVESISDLIDEASRTATEQAVRAATGTAPEDRSSDVWGTPEEDEDLDALWSAAADRHRGSHVFDDVLGPEDGWSSDTRLPPPAADPTFDHDDPDDGAPEDDEPEVFTLSVDDEEASRPGREAEEPPSAPPSAPADDHDVDDPEPFRFAAGPATTAPAAVPDHVPTAGDEEPDLFAFAFDETEDGSGRDGPDAGARSEDGDDRSLAEAATADDAPDERPPLEDPVADEPDGDRHDDGDLWGAASLSDDDASELWASDAKPDEEPVWAPAPEDGPWAPEAETAAPPPAPAAGDVGDDADDDGAWTFDVGAADEQPADEQALDEERPAAERDDDGDEPTLAESARPRVDTGWSDLSVEQATWTLDPVPTGETDPFATDDAATPDPDGFTASLDDPDDGFLPDDEPLAPTREPDPPFTTEKAALGDVIEDLLGDMPASPPGAAVEQPDDDPLDALDDALADLDQLDDVAASTPEAEAAAPTDAPASMAPPPVPDDIRDEPSDDLSDLPPPPSPDEPTGPTDGADDTDADADEDDAPDDPTPTAAPTGLSFSSKPKKRGLFGG